MWRSIIFELEHAVSDSSNLSRGAPLDGVGLLGYRSSVLPLLLLSVSASAPATENPLETLAGNSNPLAVATVRVAGQNLFTMEHYAHNGDDGVEHLERRYLDVQKNIAYRETATIVQGVQHTQHSFDRQEKQEGRLLINAGIVEYWLRRADGSIRTKRDEVDEPAVGSTGLVPFIVRDETWRQLLTGTKIRFSYLSWSKQKSYRFVLTVESATDSDRAHSVDQGTVTVVMKPSAWVVRQLFDEIRYRFRRSDRRLLEYRGRVSVQQRVEGRYEDINDALVSFSYPEN